jgi:hypothetical protein
MSEATPVVPHPAATVAGEAPASVPVVASGAPSGPPPSSKKGYYYWHGHGHERAKVGDVAPMPVPCKVDTPSNDTFDAVASTRVLPITGYSWCNNAKSVSVYVNFPEVGSMEDKVSVRFSGQRTTVEVAKGSNVHSLVLHLAYSIDASSSSFKFKPDQVVLKLMKEDATKTWNELTGKPTDDAEDDDE